MMLELTMVGLGYQAVPLTDDRRWMKRLGYHTLLIDLDRMMWVNTFGAGDGALIYETASVDPQDIEGSVRAAESASEYGRGGP